MDEENNSFVVKRKVGGSIIERRPVFSSDVKTIFVVCEQIVRSYNTQTGAFIRNYEGVNSTLVGVQLNPFNSDHLLACSDIGELLEWNWKTGELIRKLDLEFNPKIHKLIGFHILGNSNGNATCYGVFSQCGRETLFLSSFCFSSGKSKANRIHGFELNNQYHSYSFGGDMQQQFFAGIRKKMLHVALLDDKKNHKQSVGCKLALTCVACHPSLFCVLVGDISGCVLLWQGFFSRTKPVYSMYHWHTLPVHDVVFSCMGSHFYSGGGEGVLVRWTMEAPNQKKFLPRLPASLIHLSLAPENILLAITTLDNAIQLIDTSRPVSVIQPFSWSAESVRRGLQAFPAGLSVDVRSEALVLNGGTGCVQFISLSQNSLLYQVNVTGQNILTQEREKVIVNTDVIRLAMNSDGLWLATVEQRDDKDSNPELRLKFWFYNNEKQTFSLNTWIENPHQSTVYSLEFQPSSSSKELLAVTTGDDKKFRMWRLLDSQSIYKGGRIWQNESVGFFRNLPVLDVSFSDDGSLLAATFGPTLTVWISDSSELKCSLTRSLVVQQDLTCVEFGHRDCVHLVVTGCKAGIAVWNLLSLSLLWTAELPLNLLVSDRMSCTMAAFTTNNDVVLFSPLQSKPEHKQSSVVRPGTEVVAAIFAPSSKVSKRQHSQLYFATSKWEILALEKPQRSKQVDISVDQLSLAPLQPLTPFGALVAQQTTSDVKSLEGSKHRMLGIPGVAGIKNLLAPPAHTTAPMSLLCGSVLLALVREADKTPSREIVIDGASEDDSGIVSSDEEEDGNSLGERSATFDIRKEQAMAKRQEEPQVPSEYQFAHFEKELSCVLNEPLDWAQVLAE